MKKISILLFLFLLIKTNTFAQGLIASLRVGMDYNETYLIVNDVLGVSNIGDFTSIWGYRAGVALDAKVYKSFSLDSELGYSRGGFDGFNHLYRRNIDQIYLSPYRQF